MNTRTLSMEREVWRGTYALMILLAVAALFLSACNPELEDTDAGLINQLRSSVGVGELTRAADINLKAQLHADLMAQNGTIFHSADLSDGVSPGWTAIGENVAAAGSIEAAQRALEQSPDHYENLVNPDFKELGVGVTVRNGTVYLVQIFVGR